MTAKVTRRVLLGTAAAATLVPSSALGALPKRLWREGVCLNQFDTLRCIGWAAAADILACDPRDLTFKQGQRVAQVVYRRAEDLDIYPGRVGATTIQATAAALVDLGHCTDVRWLTTPDQVVAALTRGPVVFAFPWLPGMRATTTDRLILGDTDTSEGPGHGVLLTGYDPAYRGVGGVRVRNSWTKSWGKRGSVWLTVPDLRRLWAWQANPWPYGAQPATYCEAYQPVGRTHPPIREARRP